MKAKIFESFCGRMDGYDSHVNDSEEKLTVMDLTNSPVTKIPSSEYSMEQEHSEDGVLRVLTSAPFRTVIQHPQPSRLLQLEHHSNESSSPTPLGEQYHYRPLLCVQPSPSSSVTHNLHQLSAADRKKKKQPKPIPEESKDDAYWERRKRNNESAKRSRELRRMKEQHTSIRVVHLEQENLQLRTEVSMLREEVEKLRELICAKR